MMCSCESNSNEISFDQTLYNEFQFFFDILKSKSLSALFQPIVDLKHHSIYGYESLIRGPSDSLYHNPVTLFDTAIRSGRLLELDLLCREVGINSFQNKHLPGKLFLNATPESLLEPGHRSGLTLEILDKVGVHPSNVVIEMTEQYPMDNFDVMRTAVEHYKSMGFEIAIDDLGAGYSGLRRWSEFMPDYVKIDRHFIQNIHDDSVKQSFVRSIIEIAKELDCKVIAEGIETQEEYRTIFGMGIEIGQGYYFSRPLSVPPQSISNEVFSCSSHEDCGKRNNSVSEKIVTLLNKAPVVAPDTTLEEVHSLFSKSKDLTSVVVLNKDEEPLGLIRRSNLLTTLSSVYGRALYGSKSIIDFIDKASVIADKEWSIKQVSKMVTDSMQMHIEDDFIITDKGKYAGLGKVIHLLKKITDLQIKNARYANPLTLLPGNVPIYEKIDELLNVEGEFNIAYCDIDNFKPFNDVYGYAKGDQIIKSLAKILLQHADSAVDFIGHVGGDDFIAIFKSEDWQNRCNSILNDFKDIIPGYYKDIDKENNGIWAESRNGDNSFHPIMSLSIGVISLDPSLYISYGDIAELATHAKRDAKKIMGNSLFIDRRTA